MRLHVLGCHGGELPKYKTTCFLIDMDTFTTFNEAYVEAFGDHRPARSTIAVRELPAKGQVEIEAVAFHPRG